jgi:hypothetical protein
MKRNNNFFVLKSTLSALLFSFASSSAEAQVACTGTPPPSSASASINPIGCNGSTTLNGINAETGVEYKWQTSPAGMGMWTDQTPYAPTAVYPTGPLISDQDYRIITRCIVSGDTSVSNTVTVDVKSFATASFTMTTDTFCAGTSNTVSIQGLPAEVYIANNGSGTYYTFLTNGSGNATVTIPALPVGTATLFLDSINGTCQADLATPDAITIETVALPTATVQASTDSICNGESFQLHVDNITMNPYSTTATVNYTNGMTGGNFSTTQVNDSVAIVPPMHGTYQYWVTSVIDQQGCFSAGVITDTATVVVDTTPTAMIYASANTVCPGSPVTFTIALTGTSPWNVTYTNGITQTPVPSTNDTVTFQINVNADTTYSIAALSDASGCPALPVDFSGAATVMVGDSAEITLNPVGPTTPICTGSPFTFNAAATGFNVNYSWLVNGAVIPGTDPNYTGETTTSLTVNNVHGLNNAIYRLVANGQCNSDTSAGDTLFVTNNNTWDGSTSTLWSDGSNWSCGTIPVITTDVIVPNVPNKPDVNIPNAVCNNLTVNALSSIEFTGIGSALEIAGNTTLLPNSQFNPLGGEVIFSGSTSQNIPPAAYGAITVRGGGVKIPADSIEVVGAFTLDSGLVMLNNYNLVLQTPSLFTGGNEMSYVMTNGTGVVRAMNLGILDSTTFHIGNSTYNPLGFRNAGVTDNYSVRVIDEVYQDGTGSNTTLAAFPNVDRTWFVEEGSAGGSLVNMSPGWMLGTGANGFDQNYVYVAHHNGTIWEALHDSTQVAPSFTGLNPYFAHASGVTTFSPFTVGSGTQFPLSVNLSDIAAANVGTRNRVDWKSASEATGDVYELERSLDGKNFTGIATVNAKGEASSYTYWDDKAATGINYYRIKTTDLNGRYGFSKVVSAAVNTVAGFSLDAYPNPVSNTVNVRVNGSIGADATVIVTDLAGKVIKTVKPESDRLSIDMSDVAPGVYFIKYSDDANNGSIKISKQ